MAKNNRELKLDFNERSDGSPAWVEGKLNKLSKLPLWKYPQRSDLERKISHFYKIKPAQVLATNGADEAIQIILLACKFNYLNIDKILLPTPTFSVYEKELQQWQLNFIKINPEKDFSIKQNEIITQFENSQRSLLILVRPNNPTGELVAADFIGQLLSIAKNNNNLLLIDEAYADFANENCNSLAADNVHLIILKSFSKAYGLAGIRTGYILATENIINQLNTICMPFNISTISLALAAGCFDIEAQQEVRSYVEQIKKNRETLLKFLVQLKITSLPSQGNFVFFELTRKKYQFFINLCQQQKIQVRQFTDETLENTIRITIPLDISRLEKLFKLAFNPDLICLDMDGTLIDVSRSYDEAIKATVHFFSNEKINSHKINALRNQGGFNNDWLLSQEILKQLGFEIALESVIKQFQRFYLGTSSTMGLIENEHTLIFAETLSILKQTTLAIVTGRPRAEAELGASMLKLDCDIVSIDDVSDGKPAAESILLAMKNTAAKICWMIGDNVDDILSALNAGVIAIGINHIGTKNNEQTLYRAGANIVLNNINEVEQLL